MRGLTAAIAFLTRIPLGGGSRDLNGAAPWFPWVGTLVGLVAAGTYAAAHRWLPSALAAVLATTAGVLLTGALHEDGLADTADALGSGATGEEALRILRDPRLGTYGVIAVVVSLVWRVLTLASLPPAWALGGLVLAHALGRSAAVVLAAIAEPARADGLGRAAVLEIRPVDTSVATISALVIGSVAAGVWLVPVVVLAALSFLFWRGLATRRLGGVTGDVLGACEQVVEILALTTVAVAAWNGVPPWWA